MRKLFITLFVCGLVACGAKTDLEVSAGSVSGAGGEWVSAGHVSSSSSSVASSSSSSSNSSSSSSSSGTGGEGGGNTIDPSEPCTDQEDGIPCVSPYDGQIGVCEQEVCVFCNGKKLGEVVKGYPIDPEACYQYVCSTDPGDSHFAFPTVQYHPLDEACTYKAMNIEGFCSEDGQCCGWVEEAQDHICGPGAND